MYLVFGKITYYLFEHDKIFTKHSTRSLKRGKAILTYFHGYLEQESSIDCILRKAIMTPLEATTLNIVVYTNMFIFFGKSKRGRVWGKS